MYLKSATISRLLQLNNMLDTICTDLETSKKLKELKINVETKFYWEEDFSNEYNSIGCWFERPQDQEPYCKFTSAYTLEQILNILPKIIKVEGGYTDLILDIDNGWIGYSDNIWIGFEHKNKATSAAILLIQLIEDEILTTPTSINK